MTRSKYKDRKMETYPKRPDARAEDPRSANGYHCAARQLGHEAVPARLAASLTIPVCSATFPDASGSSDSQLAACLDRFGIGKLDWKLPSTPHATSLTMRYASK